MATRELLLELKKLHSARNQPRTVTVEFPAGSEVSEPIDLGGACVVGYLTDSNWVAAHVTIQLSDGDAWRDLHLNGELVTFNIAPNTATLGVFLPVADLSVRLKRPAKDIARSLRILLN
jgi:hypothetical protein